MGGDRAGESKAVMGGKLPRVKACAHRWENVAVIRVGLVKACAHRWENVAVIARDGPSQVLSQSAMAVQL